MRNATRRGRRTNVRGSASRFDQAAQDFGDAPGLRDAAARREWRLGVEDLVDRADATLRKVLLEAAQKTAGFRASLGMHLEPGVDERADQPGPHGALVIGRVAGAHSAEITRLVFGDRKSTR